jgi:hypothetical protein
MLGRGDDQNVPDSRQHQRAQRIVDHRLVVDGQKLLADDGRHRHQTGAAAAGENDPLHEFCNRRLL